MLVRFEVGGFVQGRREGSLFGDKRRACGRINKSNLGPIVGLWGREWRGEGGEMFSSIEVAGAC